MSKPTLTPSQAKLILLHAAKRSVENLKDIMLDKRVAEVANLADHEIFEAARTAYLKELDSNITYHKRSENK